MKNLRYYIPAVYLLYMLMLPSCHSHDNHSEEEHEHAHNHEQEHVHDHEHSHEHNESNEGKGGHDDDVITLEPDDAKFLGVDADTVYPTPFSNVIHVTGQLESVPGDVYTASSQSSGIVSLNSSTVPGASVHQGSLLATISARGIAGGDANEGAYQNMLSAKKELDRVRPLHEEGIVSTRDFNAIESEYQRALAAYSGTRSGSSVMSKISGVITYVFVSDGEYVEAGAPVAAISKGLNLIVRADVPVRKLSELRDIADGNIIFTGNDSVYSMSKLNSRRMSERPVTMNGAYVPVYFMLDNPGSVVPGMTADLYLHGNSAGNSLIVPISAVSEQQGTYFVYIKLDEDCYKKVPVTLGRNDGENVEITKGLESGMTVVTKGMTFVKLAESKGAVPEGHSHNH